MLNYKHIILLSSLLLLKIPGVSGQSQDFNLWTGISLEKDIYKGFKIELELENRWKDNLNQNDQSLADIGISYSKKAFSASIIYRITHIIDSDGEYLYGNRLTYQAGYKYDIDRFRIMLRARYQNHYESLVSSENGYIPETHLRGRVKLLYNIKGIPVDPLIMYEAFTLIDNTEDFRIIKQRYSLGFNYKFNKKNSLGLVYHIQPDINVADPKTRYIAAIKYKIEL